MLEQKEVVEKKKLGIGALTIITILAILLVIVGIVFILRYMGRQKLTTAIAGTETVTIGNTEESLRKNQIMYDGKVYEQKEGLLTVLVMGIDKETYTSVGGESGTDEAEGELAGGQADSLFLMILDSVEKNVSIVSINRNSMVDVDVFDAEGNYQGVFTKQVALQHGYGDGGEESCERQVKTVSRMFHNIPIDSYVAISMDAIPELNDAVGGITVEVLDDIIYPEYDMELHQGDTVTLQGEKAYWYVRLRNENIFNSNEIRLQRQKQYLTTFAATAKQQASSDIRVAVNLYKIAQKYMVTDIDLSSFTYLATEALGCSFDINSMYSLEGETIKGNQFEEFYLDDDALQELIVQLFYQPI